MEEEVVEQKAKAEKWELKEETAISVLNRVPMFTRWFFFYVSFTVELVRCAPWHNECLKLKRGRKLVVQHEIWQTVM
jgi:hypothetical protein